MNSTNNESNGNTGMKSIRDQLALIEQARKRLMQDLEAKVADLPKHLGLGSLDEVLELIRAKNETGTVEAFAGAAMPMRSDATTAYRRKGQRGKAIAPTVREQIKQALLRGEEGILISRRVGVSASTVSGIRKALEAAGELKS